jgi:hypothetical protein
LLNQLNVDISYSSARAIFLVIGKHTEPIFTLLYQNLMALFKQFGGVSLVCVYSGSCLVGIDRIFKFHNGGLITFIKGNLVQARHIVFD